MVFTDEHFIESLLLLELFYDVKASGSSNAVRVPLAKKKVCFLYFLPFFL